MKIGMIQAKYPTSYKETLEVIEVFKDIALNQCSGIDLLVLPEYSNCPGMKEMDKIKDHIDEHNNDFINTLKEAAIDNCMSILACIVTNQGHDYYNSVIYISDIGEIEGIYDKTHLSYVESDILKLKQGNELLFIDINGVKITFAICFELYFSEFFESLSAQKPDIIVSPSYQRSESSEVVIKQIQARALDSESFVVRCSYSMGEDSIKGGYSSISNPSGETLINAKQETGLFVVEVDPKEKRMRPLAHGLDKQLSKDIVDNFRRPSMYRTGGSGVKDINQYSYPRVCAHRGLSKTTPENTLIAFGAAISAGADEIEFDLRLTKDNHIILMHDSSVDRTTNGSGEVSDLTLEEIKELDAGYDLGSNWANVKIPTVDEVFNEFSGRICMNIHIYTPGHEKQVISYVNKLIEKHDNAKFSTFSGDEALLAAALEVAPKISRNCLAHQGDPNQVEYALKYKCNQIQVFRNISDKELAVIKDNGIICNLFFSDDLEEAQKYITRGVDTILTNYANIMVNKIK